jgi:hypothetical protein
MKKITLMFVMMLGMSIVTFAKDGNNLKINEKPGTRYEFMSIYTTCTRADGTTFPLQTGTCVRTIVDDIIVSTDCKDNNKRCPDNSPTVRQIEP